MSNILLGSINNNKNFNVENDEIIKDDKYLYLNLDKEKDVVCLFPSRTAFSERILMPLLRKETKFIYTYLKNLGTKIEKLDIVEEDYSKRFEYIGKEEMEIEIFKTNIEKICDRG